MKLSIILCVYNEIRVIEKSFHELYKNCEKKQIEYEIIIIDNASTDGTKEWLESLRNEKVIKILNNKNIGKGGSIKKGINKAAGEFLIIFDPDQEYEIQSIWDCLNQLKKTDAMCVLGSRLLGERKVYKYAINYYGVIFLSKIINFLYSTNLTDTATAIKCFKSDFIKNVPLKSNGFNLDFELVCRTALLGGKIEEVSINYFPRTKKEGKKIKAFKDGIQSILVILRDRIFKI
jgi:glycosyltransferase involved in cell wall biosynthesis